MKKIAAIIGCLLGINNGQTLFIENQMIVKMEEEHYALNRVMNHQGIAETGISEIDDLNGLYGCIDIKKLYRGPNENAMGLFVFTFNDGVMNDSIIEQYSQLNDIAWAELDFLFSIGETYPIDWNDSL